MGKARQLSQLLSGGTSGVVQFSGTGAVQVPSGTTAERPTPGNGMLRYNSTIGLLESYSPSGWGSISSPPVITSVSPTTFNGEQGTQFTINGSFFTTNSTVSFITAAGTEVLAASTSFVSSSQLTATTPRDFTVAEEPLTVKVLSPSGLFSTLSSAVDCGGVPTWNTAAGQLGASTNGNTSFTATLSASDPDSAATISYSVTSGSLPSGLTLNSSTGVISGTTPAVGSNTTYNFTVTATDNAGNQTARAFSIIILFNPVADSGGGAGYATVYSDATNANQVTSTSNGIYYANAQAASPNNPGNWLNFETPASTSYFTVHTGHDGVSPTWLVVRVSDNTPRVLNRYRWVKHSNAAGNIDIYGSNQAIGAANYQTMSNWTFLGRGHMGGQSSESDGTVKTATFNPNNYGYRWYMVLVRDISSTPLTYPTNGTMGGYAMYGATFDKV